MQTFTLQSPAEAINMLLDHARAVGTETVPLADAAGRVLAQSVQADRPSPACDVSAMDGYVLRTSDLAKTGSHTGPLTLAIVADAPPGVAPPPMPDNRPGNGADGATTLRIMTGSPIPPGADLVIKREDTTENLDGPSPSITIEPAALAKCSPGDNIRREGENIASGTVVAEPGVVISPTRAGMLSLFGLHIVTVHRKVRTAIITTGDEVLPADATPDPWQLRDSNGPALAAFLKDNAWLDAAPPAHADDTPELIRAAIENALVSADLLFLTGGVSMGDRDYVPDILRELGANVLFHKLPQRPGKPALAAVMPGGQIVLALPGNPVAVSVTAKRLGAPVLRKLAGMTTAEPDRLVSLDKSDGKSLKLYWHRLVHLLPDGTAELVSTMGSGDVASAANADGFIEVPPGDTGNNAYPFYPWTL